MICNLWLTIYRFTDLRVAKEVGSDGSTAGGGRSDLSEWPRSVCNAAAPSARRTPGTATVHSTMFFFLSHRLRPPPHNRSLVRVQQGEPKNTHSKECVFFYPSRRLGISSRFSVYIIAVGVYHHRRCILLRLDEIQHCVLMIYNASH